MNLLTLVLTACLSWSVGASSLDIPGFAQTLWGSLHFRDAEMVSRVHSIGLHREAQLALKPWVEVSQNAFLGIDGEGRLIQIVRADSRVMAFLLSGNHKIKDIFFHKEGHLVAMDPAGRLFMFDWERWSQGVLPGILRRSIARYFISVGIAGLAVVDIAALSQSPVNSFEVLGSLGLAASTGIFIEGFRSSMEFDAANELTDGLVPLGAQVQGYRDHRFLRGVKGEIADYELLGQQGWVSLKTLMDRSPISLKSQNMDLRCEHFLLPKGIPAKDYEPQF